MPPTLILIRHAEGAHNATSRSTYVKVRSFLDQYTSLTHAAKNSPGDYFLHDPDLTELGREQCLETRQSLMENPLAQQAGLIVVSPMRRTIQTALGCLDWLIDKGVKIEADADWQGNKAFLLLTHPITTP